MQQAYPSPHSLASDPYDPPSPHDRREDTEAVFQNSTPVPGPSRQYGMLGATAGPSTGLGLRREYSDVESDLMDAPFAPSSAPATPSVKGTTHPPEFIHTHHPRRGSMTPLGLNVISPRPPGNAPYGGVTPTQTFQPSFGTQRSVGFNPTAFPYTENSPTMGNNRRSSAASTSSTLTQSRPAGQSLSASGANRDRRRSSLTPYIPTLAPPSPSRHTAKGRNSRPSSSDGSGAPPMHTRNRTEPPSKTIGSSARDEYQDSVGEFGRRGSMPHLAYGGMHASSSRPWNPSLPTQRGSVGDENDPAVEGGFKFGSIPSPSAASVALRAIDVSPGSRRGSLAGGVLFPRGDVFAEAEAEEAEKQRRAFLAATYGEDGKRARERLSIGGPGLQTPQGSPGGGASASRRPSLMLWEKLGMQAAHRAVGPLDVGSASAPALPIFSGYEDSEALGQRRGSLPIAIPGGTMGVLARSSSRREAKEARLHDMDAPIIVTDTDAEAEAEEDLSEEEEEPDFPMEYAGTTGLTAPIRPLPPLLPLSDPGPRLLPSTLALHRASHLLNARNLQPEPLPHPLPPSLHPPAPVDLAEFDIDFILAGSQAQLGGKKGKNAPIDSLSPRAAPSTPTLNLGSGGEDDTFAKFVGQFDDEYGDRRGEWTFRSSTTVTSNEELRDPLDRSASREAVKAEWESLGAGRYELYGNGEVRSIKSGSVWRVRKTAGREYELEELKKGLGIKSPLLGDSESSGTVKPNANTNPTFSARSEPYCLTSKAQHCECGGVKSASAIAAAAAAVRHRSASSRANSGSIPAPRAAQIRASVSDATARTGRIGSEDSAATSKPPLSTSAPLGSALNAMLPKKKRQNSNQKEMEEEGRGRQSGVFSKKGTERSPSRDRGDKKKSGGGGFGGVLKRGLASIKHSGQSDEKKVAREEKERERMQSQSWSGALLSHRDGPSWMHPSGRTTSTSHGLPSPHYYAAQRKSSISLQTGSVTPSQASTDERGSGTPNPDETDRCSSDVMLDDAGQWKEGKGWNGVPEDAVAMVVPIESEGPNGPAGIVSPIPAAGTETPNPDNHRQALLVWFVPFNSDSEDRPPLTTLASTTSSRDTGVSSDSPKDSTSSSSLPKFQKLLRRRASKEKDGLKPTNPSVSTIASSASRPPAHVSFSSDISCRHHPLPFRSFRVVARAVDWEDLRSEVPANSPPAAPGAGYDQWAERNAALRAGLAGTSTTSSSQHPSPNPPHGRLPSPGTGTDESVSASMDAGASTSTAPTSTIGTGRNFPTVIAVCHSRSQGVEFVLEGLDRLGFCMGESAWGPTGYEEWRGSGLSEKGRELLDLLWAGCVAVLGIAA